MMGSLNEQILIRGESRSRRITFLPVEGSSIAVPSQMASDFNDILFWARLAASESRKNPRRLQREGQFLRAVASEEGYLAEFVQWRQSEVFTSREKAAMELSEAISKKSEKKCLEEMFQKARLHFSASEMIQLTLSIRAINDWYDTHARSEVFVLIVQDNPLERDLLRQQVSESKIDCVPIFVENSGDALSLLADGEQQLFKSRTIALVVDIHLPQISAEEILRNIRNLPGAEDTPVLVMTSSVNPQDIDECERLRKVSNCGMIVNVASFSEALVHIVDQNRRSYIKTPPEIIKPKDSGVKLSNFYQRLRYHFLRKYA